MIPHHAPQTSNSAPQSGQRSPADREHVEAATPDSPADRSAWTGHRNAPAQPLCANPDWPVDGPRWVLEALGGVAA